MSTQSILGVVGGVVGSFFGYPQLGFLVGSLIGAALTPKEKTEGPRIDDQKVTVSTYGAGIPTVYGTVRVGGNVVDSTDKIEVPTTTETGKGGGTENTTYQYFVHMRHVLCATPTDGSYVGIRKIWKDGKLIYDASAGVAVGAALASAESPYSFLVLYQGHEDQMPDGIEELYHGAGNVPAYRGVVSVRLNIIECPGGRVPQFSFEIGVGMSVVQENLPFADAPASDTTAAGAVIRRNEVWQFVPRGHDYDGDFRLEVRRLGPSEDTLMGSISSPGVHYGLDPCPVSGDGAPVALRMRRAAGGGLNDLHYLERYSLASTSMGAIYEYTPLTASEVINPVSAGYDSIYDKYAIRAFDSANLVILDGGAVTRTDPVPGTAGPVTMFRNIVYALSQVSGQLLITSFNGTTGATITTYYGPANNDVAIGWAALHPTLGTLYVWCRNDPDANVYSVDLQSGLWTLLSTIVQTQPVGKESRLPTTFFADTNGALIGPSDPNPGRYYYNYITFNSVHLLDASVQGILADQCTRAGLTSSQFDVSEIDDSVHGYTLTNPASARSNIQPLMTAFAIDASEDDGKIKFFHRAAQTPVALIDYDELGTAEDGSESGDPMPLTRAQEAELPRSVSVSYQNKDFDYQTGTERAIRQITNSVLDQTVDLPLAVDSDVAATVAQRALYDAWNERDKRSFKVSRKFAFLSPGDVTTIEYPRGFLGDWRLTKITDTGVLIEGECVPSNPEIYEQTAVGGTGYQGQVVAPLPAPTRLQLLDIPILRDEDNNAGIYAAMDSYGSQPASAELFVGDDDNTLVSRGTVSGSAPIGFAETTLSAWSGNLVDETNLVTVNIGDDVFNSVTRDVLLSNGGEFWALGAPGRWEIGSSALGASLGNGRYILSRHLRGLFGTEYLTGTHQAGDTFVLIRIVGILRPSMSVGEIGQTKSYRAVTKGRSFDSVASQTYANQAEGLEPLSPVNARRAFASRDIQVDRRSRLSMNNASGILPLGEMAEAYHWSFYTSSAFTTVFSTVITTTSILTEAQQMAAGITPSATAYLRVAQVSDSVGTGHELQAIL